MFGPLGTEELLVLLPLILIFYGLPLALVLGIVVILRRMDKRAEQIERLLTNRN